MSSSPYLSNAPAPQTPRPNLAFRELRGQRSPGEFAAAVRRAAREIGERVSCDARYIGRVEAGEIRCPNYAYERVFLHMFPGRSLADLGFAPRSAVRGRAVRPLAAEPARHDHPPHAPHAPRTDHDSASHDEHVHPPREETDPPHEYTHHAYTHHEESDVRRRAFMTGMTGSTATVAVAALTPFGVPIGAAAQDPAQDTPLERHPARAGVGAVEEAIRRIRLLDDRHGADGLYERAAAPLRTAFELLDAGAAPPEDIQRLQTGAGELAISVGWLAHDSGRFDDARSHYAEALATARMAGDEALEAHAFCNTAFLARDAGRPREAVRAAQAAARIAAHLGSPRLLSLLALREAGGWAGLGDRRACERSLARAQALFARGTTEADPEWMSFYGEAELEGLESQCWSALGDWVRAARHARRSVALQDPHFTRNIALYTAEMADDLARSGRPDEAAAAGARALALLRDVRSSRIEAMLATTARVLLPHQRDSGVAAFLEARTTTRV
ncbi:tetratricopeptide repeat protein [Streptomyces sp. NPDC050145]|uniref:tetratricopeptide repeat protein n=1 Tax=Streptomyces sp. NPDC050145 TaxID=3365602 RepID=UPI00379FC3B8